MLWLIYPLLLDIMTKQGHETAVALSDINLEERDDKESSFGVPEVKVQTENEDSFQHIAEQEPSTQDQPCG